MDLMPSEAAAFERARASGRTPVVFIHGLWLLPSSWEPWARLFEEAGYAAVIAGWPDGADTVAEARAHPDRFAGKRVAQVSAHLEEQVRALPRRPVLVGHSFGGLFAQMLAGRGLSAATVAIDPAPFRGVLPLPWSALRSAMPVLRNPANRRRAVMPPYEAFRYSWFNALPEAEARALYEELVVPTPAMPLFQAAVANLNPRSELRVDTRNPDRGPLLLVSGTADHIVPHAMTRASFGRQRRNPGVTELAEVEGRGHSLTIDGGWREVAGIALSFIRRFA